MDIRHRTLDFMQGFSNFFVFQPGAHVINTIKDINYGIRNAITEEKFPLQISVIYGENKLNS